MSIWFRNPCVYGIVIITALVLIFAYPVIAQEGVPGELLGRTQFIKVGTQQGTGFAIDYQGKLYIVTARHVAIGLPESKATTTIQVRRSNEWLDVHIIKTHFPFSNDVDIAVLETDEKIPAFIYTSDESSGGVFMGQQVWFLGYPWGIGSKFSNNTEAPFIKRGIMSAIDSSNPNAIVLYIDGFNNPGFSGGPIIYWDLTSKQYKILGIVKGYRNDTAKVMIKGEQVESNILVNSGLLIGYSIKHAFQAIAK